MMMAANLIAIAVIFFILGIIQAFQNLTPLGGMSFHDLKFLRRKASRLQKHLIRNRNFADIVQRGGI